MAPVLVGTSPAGALAQLAAYRTQADPRFGLLVNVAGLYGFFRPGPIEPKNLISGWPAVLAALLLVVAIGYAAVLRDPARRRDGLAVLVAGVAGYFLALGDQGPTGALFRLAYEHVPGFVMMREPDKFAVLTALAYACGFGWGIDWLATRIGGRGARIGAIALAGVLPLTYTPNLSVVSAAKSRPARCRPCGRLPSVSSGRGWCCPALERVLPDPVHGSADDRQPGRLYFTGTVLTGQDPGSGYAFAGEDPEHVFLDRVIGATADPRTTQAALARLGVRFVVVAKVADWRDFADWSTCPGSALPTRARRLTSTRSGRPPGRHGTTAGSAALTRSTTGSFPADRALSPCPSRTRRAGRSMAPLSNSRMGKSASCPGRRGHRPLRPVRRRYRRRARIGRGGLAISSAAFIERRRRRRAFGRSDGAAASAGPEQDADGADGLQSMPLLLSEGGGPTDGDPLGGVLRWFMSYLAFVKKFRLL